MNRMFDLEPILGEKIGITVDGSAVTAAKGETLLAVLGALGITKISKNDHGAITGAYCGMGVCYCCVVRVNGKEKQRACRLVVKEGMEVVTRSSYFAHGGVFDGKLLAKGKAG